MERRDFLKTTVGASLALASTNLYASGSTSGNVNDYDPKGLPTTMFGSTGVRIPRIVLGLGSRFCHMKKVEDAHEMLNYALDNGFYYWDTAHVYDNTVAPPLGGSKSSEMIISEERMGEVVKNRRKEIFLSTKVSAREPSEAMKQIELSLKRLQTDKLDMLKIHNVASLKDIDEMSKKGHLIDILLKMKEQGVTRFIGFSGHGNDLQEMPNRAPFDSMLIAMNHYTPRQNTKHEETTIPAAKRKKMGILLMKAVRPKETIEGLNAPDLVRYALSLDGPDAVAVGMDSVDVVKSNLEILNNFKKLSPEKMKELAFHLAPFYRHENLPWMQKGYHDGNWVS